MSKNNKEVREQGYYRVKFHDAWLIREWNGAGWLIPGYSGVADGLDYSEVGSTPINPEPTQPPSEGSGEVGLRWVSEIVIREFLRNDERIIRTEMQDECCKLIQRFLKKFGENKPQAGKAQQLKQEILKRFGKYLRVEPLDFTPNLSAQMDLYAKAYLEEYTLPSNVDERKFTLEEMIDAYVDGIIQSTRNNQGRPSKTQEQYFKEKFNIILP